MTIMKLFRSLAVVAAVTSRCWAADACPSTEGANAHPTFDAALLKEGRFTYHTTLGGKSLGDTVIEIRRVGATYRITMSAADIAQSWEATVKPSFGPLTAHLKMRARGVPYEMSLRYDGTRITGEESKEGVTTPVSATSTGVVIDQRVDWASMMAIEAGAGSSMTMSVYDPSTGFSPMLGKVGTAAGMVRFDYSICKREHVENYTVFATATTPRHMLREDMPNGLVSELIRVEP